MQALSSLCSGRAQVQYIGYFDTEEAAAFAYDEAILRLRGPTAQINFPAGAEPAPAAAAAAAAEAPLQAAPDAAQACTACCLIVPLLYFWGRCLCML
jgi:hypothetical protein